MKCNFRELNQKLHICTCDTIVMPQLYKSGRCREVICGMRISVNSIDTAMNFIDSQEVVQDEITVKFREMVGQSLLQVSTSTEDLGRLDEDGGFISGCFVVSNPSNQMNLDFTLSAGQASLTVVRGHLIGKEATPSTGSGEKSEIAREYCLPVTEYGLIEEPAEPLLAGTEC